MAEPENGRAREQPSPRIAEPEKLGLGACLISIYIPLTFTAISSCLGIDTTYNLGNFFVTSSTFHNTALQDRGTKKAPIFLGPIMIHYRCDTSSYRQLLGFIKQALWKSIQLTIGSDGDQSIQNAVKQTFPNTIHLHCTRHVKKNIERYLLKTQLVLQDRQKLLDLVFDSPESLIQAETEHQYDERLNNLRDVCSRIRESPSNQDQSSMANFYTWFLRYHNDNFRNHLIAEVRIRASYVDCHGAAKLFYNNDVESMNHVLKNAKNWELLSLSEITDTLHKQIISQRSETSRALYDVSEMELVHTYNR